MSNVLTNGEPGSAQAVQGALDRLWNQGEDLFSSLQQERLGSLVDLERRLSAINARQRRANHILPVGTAAEFSLGDFASLAQDQTSTTVRIDTQSATLKERRTDLLSLVIQQKFSTSAGTAEQLDSTSTLIRVHTDDRSIPSGTFLLTLQQAVALGVVTFDLAAMASTPQVLVEVSENGVSWRAAMRTALFGYRVVAWLDNNPVLYLRLTLTPSHPDSLGGTSFTFGLTQFTGQALEFQLRSELMTRPVVFSTASGQLVFQAEKDPDLTYYLSLAPEGTEGTFQTLVPGSSMAVPGSAQVRLDAVALDSSGQLSASLPADLYPGTLRVVDATSGVVLPVVFDLPADASPRTQVVSVVGTSMYMIPYGVPDHGRQMNVIYRHGPSRFSAILKVVFVTGSSTKSPVFRGARLEEL